MSYEGYEERLCKNGHLTIVDAYSSDNTKCPICNEDMAFVHCVDQTNDEGEPYKFEIEQEEKVEKCDKCGSVLKVIEPAKYKIPVVETTPMCQED